MTTMPAMIEFGRYSVELLRFCEFIDGRAVTGSSLFMWNATIVCTTITIFAQSLHRTTLYNANNNERKLSRYMTASQ